MSDAEGRLQKAASAPVAVSVIVPCYDVADCIEECLASVGEQDHESIELICVDDGSSDGTLERLRRLQAGVHPEMILVAQENRGAAAARNRGLREAKGDFLQFLDADDLLKPSKISTQCALIRSQTTAPPFVVGSSEIWPPGASHGTVDVPGAGESVWIQLMRSDLGITTANLWHRESVLQVGGWKDELKSSQEYDLMFRMLRVSTAILYDPSVNTIIRQRSEGISRSRPGENLLRFIDLRRRIRSYVKEAGLDVDPHGMDQILFDSIRALYAFDPESASALFRECVPAGFRPRVSGATTSSYVLAFNLLGFGLAQRVWSLKRFLASARGA